VLLFLSKGAVVYGIAMMVMLVLLMLPVDVFPRELVLTPVKIVMMVMSALSILAINILVLVAALLKFAMMVLVVHKILVMPRKDVFLH
jgi:hypothetical protein